METILSVEDLHVSYGAIRALRGVSLKVPKGQIVAILGANGAGKTTLLKCISGMVPSQQGRVVHNNLDITAVAVEKITDAGISHAPEGRQIFADMTVLENLKIGGFTVKNIQVKGENIPNNIRTKRIKALIHQNGEDALIHLNKAEALKYNLRRVYSLFPVLEERQNQVASTLSGGEMQMLAIGRALMGNPNLLILDEPSLGLAPLIVKNIFEVIKGLKALGISVLIVEQNALQTLKIADYAYVLQLGKVVNEGKAATLIKDEALIEAYLGK